MVGVSRAGGEGSPPPFRRVIVLGASNATRGLPSLIGTAQRAWGTPLEFVAAIGHGRSYGVTTRVLGRALPGILECRLWEELAQRPPAPTAALLTDIGNDLLFGTEVSVILNWLRNCLERLQPIVDRLVITRLPLASIDRCSDWHLRLLVSLLFPNSRIPLPEARARAIELDRQLISFASQYHAYVVQPEPHWYGWDPIHVTRAQRPSAWQKYLLPWTDGQPVAPASLSRERALACLRARPRQWAFLRVDRERAQPCARLSDGTTLSLY